MAHFSGFSHLDEQSVRQRPPTKNRRHPDPTYPNHHPTSTLEATIVSINQFGFGFKDNFGTYAYRVDQDTKFWKNFTEQPPQPFVIGDQIVAEFKTSKKLGTVIEELTDPTTYRWLKDNRKNVQLGKLIAGKPGSIQFQFADGTRFNYLTNEKSRVLINNKLSGIKDLKVGNTYWVQPRTTPPSKHPLNFSPTRSTKNSTQTSKTTSSSAPCKRSTPKNQPSPSPMLKAPSGDSS